MSHHLTKSIRAQAPSAMKAYAKLLANKNLLSLARGKHTLFSATNADIDRPATL
jgi:hypothetical protein